MYRLPSQMPMPVITTPQLRTLAELWASKRRDDAIPCRSDFSDDTCGHGSVTC